MLALGPLVLAPVSETFGRRPQIIVCTAMYVSLLFLLPFFFSFVVTPQRRTRRLHATSDLFSSRHSITVLFLGMSLAPNLACLAVCRLVQGAASSIEGPTAAGVVADLYRKTDRAPAMSIFVLGVFTAIASGPVVGNWVAQCLGWRWGAFPFLRQAGDR
jgi:MFS family permease